MHRDTVVIKFLDAVDADLCSGTLRDVEDYVREFPGHEELIRSEYENLREKGRATSAIGESPRWIHERYRILESLGRGGFGEVFLAEDESMHRRVAIKVLSGLRALSDEWRARLLREAHIANRISDPGLCPVHDVGFEGGSPFLVMPWIPGRSLDRLIASSAARGEGPVQLTPEGDPRARRDAFLRLIEHVGRTLHVAHLAGVIHRDVKPANIVVRPDGTPTLIDFGLAWLESSEALTRSGTLGTTAYLAPEVLRREVSEPGPQLDVWSLGVVLFEGLTLERPFSVSSSASLASAGSEAPLPRLGRQHGWALQAIVETALARRPRDRYPTMEAFADDLARLRRGESVKARAAGPVRRALAWIRSRPRSFGLALAVLAVVVSVSAFAILHWTRQRELRVVGRAIDALVEGIDQVVVDSEEAKRFGLSLGRRVEQAETLLRVVRELRDEVTTSVDIERSLARVLLACGKLHLERSETELGSTRVEEALRIHREFIARGQATEEDETAISLALILRGDAHQHIGHLEESLRDYELALEIDERLLNARPNDPRRISDVGFGDLRIGTNLIRIGRTEEGLESMRRAVERLERAQRLDPENEEREEHTAEALLEYTSFLRIQGHEERSRALLDEWEPRVRAHALRFPKDPRAWTRLATLLAQRISFGGVAEERLRLADALVEAAQRGLDLEPEVAHAMLRLGTACHHRSRALTDLARLEEARRAAEESLSWTSKAFARNPRDRLIHHMQVLALLRLGQTSEAVGEWDRARTFREEAVLLGERRWRASPRKHEDVLAFARLLCQADLGGQTDPERALTLLADARARGLELGADAQGVERRARELIEERTR